MKALLPYKPHGVRVFILESGDSQSSLKQPFTVVWGFHFINVFSPVVFFVCFLLGFHHEIDLP